MFDLSNTNPVMFPTAVTSVMETWHPTVTLSSFSLFVHKLDDGK